MASNDFQYQLGFGKYDETNLQALCSTCHSRKTVYERESAKRGGGGGVPLAPWPYVPRSLATKSNDGPEWARGVPGLRPGR